MPRRKTHRSRRLQLETCEDRILCSASAPAEEAPHHDEVAATVSGPSALSSPVEGVLDAGADPPAVVAAEPRRELIFVDTGVEDYQWFVDDVLAHKAPGAEIDVVLLDAERDGIAQISAALAGRSGIDAIHFVTHGTDRAVKLGATWIDAAAFAQNRDAIAGWGAALDGEADLLFYGCDLAASAAGRELLAQLSSATSADLAASTNDTGSAALGGDWVLEYRLGEIASTLPFTGGLTDAWDGTLNTFTVTNTNDSGAGSLRAAITSANGLAGTDTINFNIAGAGPHTINLASALPTITGTVILDGWSEPDYAGTPIIELNGASAGAGADGLYITASNSTIRGLVINRFNDDGIVIDGGDGNVIVGNYIGTDVTGAIDLGNGDDGMVIIAAAANNIIGGTTSAERNIVSGNGGTAIDIFGAGTTGNTIQGNYIGTNAAGTAGLGNDAEGVFIESGATGNTIGGTATGARNIISSNAAGGIQITGAGTSGNLIVGNYIGTDATGLIDLGNGVDGIFLDNSASNNVIGGSAAGSTNIIAGNDDDGIQFRNGSSNNRVEGNWIGIGADGGTIIGNTDDGIRVQNDASAPTGNVLIGNRIAGSGNQGIDIGPDGVTTNDAGDGDAGANSLQNYPVLTAATINGTQVTITGSFNSTASSQFRVEFFASSDIDATGYGEGARYLGFANVTTDGSGNATISTTLTAAVAAGEFITATATKSNVTFTTFTDTSEFSAATVASPFGTMIWRASGDTSPNTSDWSGTDFTIAGNSASVGQWRIIQVAEAPTRNEVIAVGIGSTGSVTGEMWNGAAWSALPINPLGTVASTQYWSADVAYESVSGDGMLVWLNGNNLQYSVWNGTSWTAAAALGNWAAVNGGNPAFQVKLASKPTGDEMVLVATTNAGSDFAFVWNGSSWSNATALDATAGAAQASYVTYEQQSGRAMAVYAKGAASTVYFRTWNGSSWSAEGSIAAPGGTTSGLDFLRLDADPQSNRIIFGAETTGAAGTPDIWFNVWDGSTWGTSQIGTTTGVDQAFPGFDVAFESYSGEAIVAYGVTGSSTVRYRTWSSGGGWSAEQSGPNLGGVPNTITLDSAPTSDAVMLSVQDANSDLHNVPWSGTSWGTSTTQDLNTGETSVQPFAFVWYATAPVAANDSYSVNEDATLVVQPTTTNLANWWKLNDGGASQTATDSGTLGNNATLGSTAGVDAADPVWTSGYVGTGALTFDGVDDYVATTSSVTQTANNFTLSTWFQTTTTTGQQHLLWQGYSGGNGFGDPVNTTASAEMNLSIGGYNQDNKIVFFFGYEVAPVSTAGIYIVSNSDFTDTTQWHNVAVTVSDLGGGVFSASLYVDGVLEGTDTGTQNDRSQWSGPMLIGRPSAATRFFSGEMDDVRVYDAALTAAQVQQIAKAGILSNDTDVDSSSIHVNTSVISGPTNGTLTMSLDGSFTYTPNSNFAGTDSFTYKASDGSLDSNTATVMITVNQVNDAPVITSNGGGVSASISIAENTTAVTTVTSTDIDGGTAGYSIAGGADAAKFTINSSTGVLSFLSAPDFETATDAGGNNVYDVTVQVSDGNGGTDTQAIAVTVTNVASTLIVTTISDVSDGNVTSLEALNANKGADGQISLREAIQAANASAGLDTITFNIAGAGPHTINLLSALPAITDAVFIDGESEPDYAGVPIIELNGAGAGVGVDGLRITASNSTIRDLVINRFGDDGIEISGSNNTIIGSYLGLGVDGVTDFGNTGSGIEINGGATLNTIGGTGSGNGNVISGNSADGITITGGASGTSVLDNLIGSDAGGTLDRGNTGAGVVIINASSNTIGGSGLGAGNVIFGNDTHGVLIGGGGADANEVYGNQITSNTGHGVLISNTPQNNRIGGTVAGQGNTIASNSGSGVVVYSGSAGTRIQGNAIYSNTGLGIDLSASGVATDGVTTNDAGDPDSGGNTLQNTPVLASVYTNGSQVKIDASLDSTANSTFRIEFFASTSADPSGSGEAQRYLGYADATTDPDGIVAFSTTLTVAVAAGEFVTATATDPNGNTSEFSMNAVASLPTITVSAPVATESVDPYVVFVVELTMPSTGAVTVNLALANVTATGGGTDYGTAGAGNLQVSLDDGATWADATSATIAAGQTSFLVRTPIVNDGLAESAETFTLTATRTAGSTSNASAIGTASINDNNGAPISSGTGTFAVVQGNRLYSASFDTGRVTLLTTSPYVTNATQINSLGFDAINGIFYYTSNQSTSSNNDIYGYDARSGTHFILTTNVSSFGVTLGSAGLGGAGGDFNGGSYFFSTEGGGGSSRDQVYRVNFVAGSAGRTISSITKIAEDNFSGATDFGDILVDTASGRLYMFNAGSPISVDEYRLNTAPTLATYVQRDTLAGISQAARDRFNNLYNVSSTVRRYDPTGAGSLGAAVTLTTDGTTAFGSAADAGAFIPAEGTIGDRVWYDADTDGVQDGGETGVVGVTVRLYDDVDSDGVIDAGESLLGTTLTGANGVYTFTKILPGSYIIQVTDPTNIMDGAASTTGGSLQSANVTLIGETITNKDFGYEQRATLTVSATSATVTEGTDTYAVFTASLSNMLLSAVTMDFTLANVTATGGGTDYGASGAGNLQVSADGGASWSDATSATIAAGSTSVLVRTPIVNDALDEAAETFTLTATVTSGLTANPSDVSTATILDNDPAPSLSIDDVTVNEATGTATFTVTLNTASGQAVSVNYATASGTALAGSDFTSTTGTLSFAAGTLTQTISVPITNDTTFEGSETFNVNLSAATNATISDSQGVGTIRDDGTGSGGTNDDTPTIAVSSPAVTEGTDSHAVFTVSLSNASTTAVSFNLALANVTATGTGTDYGTGGAGNLQVSTDGGTSWADATSATIAAGSPSVLVRTPIVNDALDENAETFTLTATRTAGTTTNASAAGTATITDNDPTPSFTIDDVTVNEAAGTATFTVTLSAASGLATSVAYATSNGTATAGSDYTNTSGTLNFAAGVVSQTVVVSIANDTTFESSETFNVTLSGATNATIADATGVGTIRDDGTGSGGTDNDTPTLSVSSPAVTEGTDSFAVFTVSLSNASTQATTVNLALANVTATGAGTDYGTGGAGNLQVSTDGGTSWADATSATIAAGSTSVLVRTPIVNDTLDENAETFTLTATRAAGTTTNASAAGTATITDNDPQPSFSIDDVTVNEAAGTATFTVTLNTASGLATSVNYATSNGTATSGSDFTNTSGTLNFAAGVVSQTVVVSIANDATFENSETFNVDLSGAANATIADNQGVGTIRDDGTGSGGTDNDTPTLAVSSPAVTEGTGTHAVFTVSLSNASTTAVSFNLALANVTASGAGTDYGTSGAGNLQVSTDGGTSWADATSATIAAGSTSVLVRTPIVNDTLDENAESFTLTATRTAGTTTNASAAGTATITDNDPAPSFSIDDVTVNEAAGTATFTVTLNTASGLATSVAYATSSGTATSGSDFTSTSGTLNFAAGVVSQTITVPILNDATFENSESFNVTLSGATNATIADATGVGTIRDDGTGSGGTDDDTPMLAVSSPAVTEGTDAHAVFTVSLSNASTQATTVNLALANVTALGGGTDYGSAGAGNLQVSTDGGTSWADATSATIAAGSTSVLVHTPIVNDTLDENAETFTLTATRTAGTTTNASAAGTATITDDDAQPSFSIDDVTVNEAAGTATFTVTLNTASGLATSVAYATSSGTATSGADFTSTSGTLNFAAGVVSQTITVPILNDATFENSETFNVTLSAATNATIADATGIGTIRDDGSGSGGTDDDTPTLAVSSPSVTEGTDTHAVFTVSLSNASTTAVSFNLALANLTATGGAVDYGTGGTGNLQVSTDGGTTWADAMSATIAAGSTSVLVRTPIVNDTLDENAETFTLTATRTAGTTTNASAAGTATITDNDPQPSFSIDDVMVNEAAGTATFTVTLNTTSGLATSVAYATSSGTAISGADFTSTSGTLNFAAGVVSQTITVPIANDATFENSESFNVNLSAATNATISDATGVGTIRDDGTGSGGTDDDTPTLSVSSPAVTEGTDAHAIFTVSLSNASTTAVSFNLALASVTASGAGTDYGTSGAGNLQVSTDGGTSWADATNATIAAGSTSVLVRTPIVNDTLDENAETFTLTATRTAGTTTNASAAGTATITDNDPQPSFSIDDVTVNEAAGTATFAVTLNTASGLATSVNYATSNGTATAGSDYTSTTGTLNFAAGVTSQTVVVSIANDTTFENSETFNVDLSGATNATVSDALGIGTIRDDGTGSGGTDDDTPTLAVSNVAVTEGTDPHAVFTVSLSNPSAQATTVNLALANGSATAADYGPALEVSTDGGASWNAASSATIAAGSTSVLVRTSITNDALDEPAEIFTLTVTRTAGTTTNASAIGTATITDDDPTPSFTIDDVTVNEAAGTATFTVTLSAASGQATSVAYATSNGTATAGSDYTAASGTLNFAAGVVSQTIVVPILNDATFENSETFDVNLSSAVNATIGDALGLGTIRDDGAGTGGTDNDTPTLSVSSPAVTEGTDPHAVFTVSLSNASTTAVSFNLALANVTAIGTGTDYGTGGAGNLQVSTDGGTSWSDATSATIAAGSTSVLVRTPIVNDTLDENAETFTLTATRTAGTTTNASAAGTATIADNDPQPSFSIDDVTVNEAAGTATFTVTLNTASGLATSVNFATSNGTATAGSDYTSTSGTLNFAAGVVSQTVVVSIANDTTFENSETFNVDLSAATNATIADATGVGTIRDDGTGAGGTDDDTPTLTVSNVAVTEGTDPHAVFTVSLSNPSTQATTVNLALADGSATATDYGPGLEVSTDGGATWSPASAGTIAAGSTSLLVRTPILNDALNEPAEAFTLTATRTAGTTTNASAVGTATVTDDDGPPSFSIDDVTVNEAAGTATFTVTLSTASAQATSVTYATSNGTATAGADYTGVSGTLNFAAGETTQTIVVPILNDVTFENSETFHVDLSAATNAIIADNQGAGTIRDDGTGVGGTDDDTPTLAVSSPSVTEGADPHAVFVVSLSNPSAQATTVNLALANGSAAAADYGPGLEVSTDGGATWSTASSVTIAAGSTSVLARTPITDDALDEPAETFTLTATRTAGTTTNASAIGTATITDDDATPTLAIDSVTVNEAAGTATFTVNLSAASGQAVSVNYATSNGTATAGADFTSTSGTLNFAPGATTQTIVVPIANDALFENSETFTVTLSAPTNATIATAAGTGTIRDDGTGAGGSDNDTPTLTVSNVAVTEGVDPHAVFTVSLSNASTSDVDLNLALNDGTATSVGDFTGGSPEISLDGGASWTSSATATIAAGTTSLLVRTAISDDAINEVLENFSLTATRTAGTTTNASATGTATITDNDGTPALSIDDVTVNEAAGTATFTVSLSGASALTITADFATVAGTAADGADYTGATGSVSFAPGVLTQTITVPILNDVIFEVSEAFTVLLSNAVNATIADDTGVGTIRDDGAGSGGADNDTPTLAVSSPSVTEGTDPHAVFTLSLSNPSATPVSFNLALANGSATAADYGPALEVSTDGGATWSTASAGSIAAGSTSVLVRTPITDDLLDEPAETFTLTATRTAGTTTNASALGTATITDDDATPSLSIDSVTVNEAAGTATFTVTLSAASGLPVSVNYATSNGTATAGADYTAASGTLNFSAGVVSQTIVVPIANDATFENSETFNVTLSAPTNATVATGTGVGTIRDDGTGSGGTDDDTPTLAVSGPSVTEGTDTHAVFTVSLSNPSTTAVSFNLALADGSATAADYGPALEVSTDGGTTWNAAGSATIAAGSTSVLVRTPVINDTLNESPETFTLTATRTAGPTTNASAVGTATITDDDGAPTLSVDNVSVNEAAGTATFTVTLNAASGLPVSVNFATSDLTATAGADYTATSGTLNFAAGVVSQTIVVPIANDAIFENSESFNVTLSAPTNSTIASGTGLGTIHDDGTGTGGTDDDTPTLAVSSPVVVEGTDPYAFFAVSIGNPATVPVSFNLALANGSATAADYGPALEISTDGGTTWNTATSATIAAGSTSVLVRTPITDDALDEAAETFTLTATRTAGPTTNASALGTATITDDDATPSLSIDSVTVNEAAGTATFTVTLSAPSGLPVNVGYATSDGGATAGADFTAATGTLNFAAGVVSQTIVVPIANDAIFESSESFNVTLSAPTNATIATGTGVGTILDDGTGTGGTDDDTPTLTVNNVSVTEGTDTHAVFAVSLSNPSTTPVSFNLALADGSATGADYGPALEVSTDGGTTWNAASSATIAAGSTSVLVRTPITNDALDEAAETFTLTATRTAGTTTNASAAGTATIADDDATPSLSIDSVTVNEAAGTATFTVTLSAASGLPVSVNYATSNGTATAGADFTTTTGTLNFAAGVVSQTIVVPITNDVIFENSENFNVTLSAPTNATIATGTGTGTILDDGTGGGGTDDDTPTLAVSSPAVTEGTDPHAVFAVTLSNPSSTATTVSLALADGSATGADYGSALEVSTDGGTTWSAGSSVTLAPSVTSVLVRTPITNDALDEAAETFTLTATCTAGTTTNAGAVGTATITDDDAMPSLTINDVTVNEAAGTLTFTVTPSAPSGLTVNVDFATADGTALAGADYTATSGTLTFAPGAVTQTITVPILNDALFENAEGFVLNLSNTTNATIADAAGAGTIRDDGTGSGGTDNDTPTLAVSSVSVLEGTDTHAVFALTLSNPSTTAVAVNLALVNGSATAADYGPGLEVSTDGGATWSAAAAATFVPGATSLLARTPLADDAITETPETFTLTATVASGTTTNSAAAGTATIVDDEAPPAMSINDVTVNEAAGTATFTVTLNRASSSAISANFTTGNVTALAGADYVGTAGTVNFAPGEVSQTITVSILDDSIFESSESFDLILSAATNATIADNTGIGTILDDGTGPGGTDDDTPTLSVSSPTVTEGPGRYGVFSVSLSNVSTTPVTFALALADGTATAADYGSTLQVSTNGGATWISAATATIAAGQTSVLVRTPIATDALIEPSETFTLTATVTAGTTTNPAATGTATIVDTPPAPTPLPPPFIPPSTGFDFQYDTFNNFSDDAPAGEPERLPFQRLVRSIEVDRPAPLPLAPIYSGEADPGATLVIDIFNAKGERIGSQTVVADSGGNWLATFPTTTLRDAPNTARVTQFAPTYSLNERWGHNLRTYFTPALNAGHFSLDVRGGADLTGEAAPLLAGLLLEDPLQLGAVKYGGELLPQQSTASGH